MQRIPTNHSSPNRGESPRRSGGLSLLPALLLMTLASLPARSQSLYWDANDVATGAGTAPAGIWGIDNYWSTDPNGELTTAAWTPGSTAVFSAGTDAVGAFSITLSGAQTAGALNFEEGSVTLSGATPATNLTWNGQVSVASGAGAILNVLMSGSGGLTKTGAGLLTLGNTNDFSGGLVVSAGTLAFSADTHLGPVPAAFNQTAVTLQDSTTLRLNSGVITFHANRGLTIGGAGANLEANAGAILFIPNVVDGPGATVTKVGAGEVGFYGAANNFAKLVIDQGNLRIGQSTFAGSDLSYGAVPSVFTPDAITIRNGATNRVVGSAAVTIHPNRGITLGAGGGVFRNDVSPVSLTINSAITGPGGLRKEGGQAFTINGERSYEGATVINGGGVSLTSPQNIFNGPGTGTGPLFMNSGRLFLNHANAYSSVAIAGGRIDVNTNGCLGTGTVTISPTNNVTVVNATTLGVGPVTNVTVNNDFIINTGATLAGGGVIVDLAANSGRELILNGKVSGDANWKKDNAGTGTLVLANPNNDFTGTLTNVGGTLMVAANNALGATSGGTFINSGGSLAFRGGINYSAPEPVTMSGLGRFTGGAISNETGNNSFSGPITMIGDGSAGGMLGTTLTLDGTIGESGGARLLYKIGQGTVALAASAGNTYSGGSIISNGVLIAANTTGSATGPGPVTIYPPGVLAGPGFVAGTLTVNGILSPGASPGTLNTASEIWNGGGSYVWEINDVDAGQGTDPGWDLLNLTGTLTINATSGNKFNLDITSLTPANATGPVHDFDNSADYTWTILKTTGGIIGFDAAAFNLLTSGFSNPLGNGLFLLETANGGNDLVIRFVRAPAIAIGPVNATAECATGSAVFGVSATGTAPLTYQWRFNGADIGGATAATLVINPATPATAGSYDVVVANAYGSVTSAAATLALVDTTAPVITTCAPDQTLSANANCQAAIPDLIGLVGASDTCSPVAKSQSPAAGTLVGPGAHTVTITVLDAANNPSTCNATVTVNDTTPPTITACAANQSLIATLPGCMAAIPDLTGQVVATDNCAGEITVTQDPAAGSLVGSGPHVVTLTATDAAGNPATCQATVTVNSGVTATVNSVTICPAGSATLTATTAAANPSYLWSPGGATTASIMVSPTETTVYTVTVTDGVTGCTGSGSGTVTLAPALVVTVNSATICAGGSAVLTATTDAANPTYLWSPGGATTASITVSPAETTVYMATVTDGAGCAGSGSGTVTVNPLPTVAVNSETICAGASATLTATTSAANPSYLWSPGDATAASITVSPAATTIYSVTVTDGITTCANNASGTVTVRPLPTVSVNSETVCAGGSATLTATTGAASPTYLWSPGGETTASITVSPAATTTYTVTVTDGTTTCANSASGTVTVNPLPTVTVDSPSICIGGSTTLTATTGAANPTYLWAPGGETTASITVTPAATATYSVTVTDGTTTCVGTGSGTVTVNPLPTVSVNSETICAGAPAALTATTTAANPSYLWSPGGETTASITVSPAVMTTYTVTVTDGVTTCSNSASGTVTVTPLSTVSVNSETICPGGSATLTATTTAANPTYLWSPGGETTASIMVSPTETTVYAVTVTDGTTTCANSASGTVTVNPVPTVTVNSPSICPGDSTTLTATTSAANPAYLWSPGGETTASITVTPAATTAYSVTVTDGVTGCVGSGAGTVTVRTPEVFANTGAITINDFAAASPYPSAINVSGLTATVCRVSVMLNNLSHPFPDDIDIVLIAPNGQGVLLMSDVGGANPVSGLTLTLDDSAPDSLPDSALLASGTFKPTNIGAKSDNRPDNFPSPVPAVNFVTNLSALAGINPNGPWSLYVNDDELVDIGSMGGGWSLALTTLTPIADLAVAQTPIPNPVGVGSNLTFNVTVSNRGPADADAVSLTDTLPAGMTFVSANGSQGSCVEAAGVVICALGSIAANASATVTIVVVPTAAGAGNNAVSVTAATLDLVTANNSSSASVTVLDPPVIVTGPVNQTVCADQSATFMVTASGAAPLSYQWYLNDVAIGGATSDTFTISSAQAADAGAYKVVVSNPVGATEASATLTVNPLPTVAVSSETICVGQSTTLTAVTSAASPIYLWSPGGEMTASITVSPASTTIYTVLVTDSVTGCTNSTSATVTVKELTTATALTSLTDLCPGSPANFSTTAAGEGPFIYAWRKDGSLLGETSSTLNIAAVTPADAGTYSVEVAGFCNTVTNSATLTVAGPPAITAQPQNQTTPMGNGAVFSVTATGVAPITYQWQLNGMDISGATAPSLAVSNVTLAQTGESYSVIVSNCAGATLSAAAVLTVTPIIGISFDFNTPNQYSNAPFNMKSNNWVNSTIVNGLNNPLIPIVPFESPTGGVGVATGSGALDLAFNNGNANSSTLHPVSFDFSLPGKTLVASAMVKLKAPASNNRNTQLGFTTQTNLDLDNSAGRSYMTVILQSSAQPALTYQVRQGSKPNGANTFIEGNNTAALTLTANNWYKLTATFINSNAVQAGTYYVTGLLQDMGADGLAAPTLVATMGPVTITNVDVTSAKNLYLVLRGIENTGVNFWDNVYAYATGGPVFFVQQPPSQTVAQGRQAAFRALVDGEGPYTYQWNRDGQPIPGANSWNYTTPPLLLSDSGAQYTVTVTSPNNSITSDSAIITVQAEELNVVSAGSVDGSVIGLRFDQPVTKASAETAANYTINGVAAYAAQLRDNGTDVLLTAPPAGGALPADSAFTVVAQNVTSLSGTALGANNSASGTVAGLTGYDINPLSSGLNGQVSTTPGENYSFAPGAFDIKGGGHDIFGTFDGFRFVYRQWTGDFDVKVRVPYMDVLRTPNKAGFAVRPSLDPFGPSVFAGVNPIQPGRNFYEGTVRQAYNVATTSWGNSTACNYPNTWLRFRRVGNTFMRYSSVNGTNWLFDGQTSPNPAFPETVYFGFAVCANVGTANLQQMIRAEFDNYGEFDGYSGAAITLTQSPTNVTVSAGSATTLGVTAQASGPAGQQAGELAYVWQRENGSGGWTNLATAGATNNTAGSGTLYITDNSAQFRVIVSAPGALSVTSAVAVVTVTDTAAPTVSASTLPAGSLNQLVVTFNEFVSAATALNPANYTVTNGAGTVFAVASVAFLHNDPRVVLITTENPLPAGTYGVRITGVQDLNGNTIAAVTRTFAQLPPPLAPIVVDYFFGLTNSGGINDLIANSVATHGAPSLKLTNDTPDFVVYSNVFGINPLNANFPDTLNHYGARLYTYFVPPTSGAYKFYVRADDFAQFLMNTNAVDSTNRAGAVVQVALTGNQQTYAAVRSVTNTLVGGQRYYMELRFKESTGGDGGTVAVRTDNTVPGQGEVIPGSMCAFPDAVAKPTPVTVELYTGLATLNSLAPNNVNAAFGNGGLPDLIAATNTLNFIARLPNIVGYARYFGYNTNLAQLNAGLDNYLGRIYGYFIAPSTGLFKFYIRHDDSGELWMNTNAVNSTDPAGMSLLGQINDFYDGNYRLIAQSVSLVGGQRYYLEGRWREGTGGDGMTVAVRSQSDTAVPGTQEVAQGSAFDFPTNAAPVGPVRLAGILPRTATVNEGQTLTLQAEAVGGASPYNFVWFKNGRQVMANQPFYVTPPLTSADDGAVFTLMVSNLFGSVSRSATVTVNTDTTPPALVSARASQYGNNVLVTFSEPVEPMTAQCLANYRIPGLSILAVDWDEVNRNRVALRTSPQAPNTGYTLIVNGVKDLSTAGNTLVNAMIDFSGWGSGGLGAVYVEIFTNVPATSVDWLFADPRFINSMADIAYYTNVFSAGFFANDTGLNNYGVRVSGLFMAPSNGLYRFFIRGDDGTRLFMNTNGPSPDGRVLIARNDGANSGNYQNGVGLGVTGASISPIISLTNGMPYYLEAYMKEGGGGDHLEVVMRAIDPNTLTEIGGVPTTPAVTDVLSGSFFNAPGNPDLNHLTVIEAPPATLTVMENDYLTLRIVATASPANLGYQWQRYDSLASAFVNIPGAVNSTLSFDVPLSDDGAQFRVVVSTPGTNAAFATTLTVLADTKAPRLIAASSLDGRTIGVCFDERAVPLTIGDNFNYTVNGGANAVLLAEARPDGRSAILYLETPVTGTFTVLAENIDDLAGNTLGGGLTNGVVQGFMPFDVGAPTAVGSSFSCMPGEIDVIAGGADIWTASDQGHLTLTPRYGDFDIHARVHGLTRVDAIAKAGLMVRESTNANSRTIHNLVNPPFSLGGRDLGESGARLNNSAGTALVPGSIAYPSPAIPNAWVRIKRVDGNYTTFRSTDGIHWVVVGSMNFGLPDPVLIGFATTAHNNAAPATLAEYRDVYIPNPPTILVQPAPATQSVLLGSSVSYSVVASNPPNSGPLVYQWKKDGVSISGAIASTLTLASVQTAQAGVYTVWVGNDGGATISDPVELLVDNLPPIAGTDNLSTPQDTPLMTPVGTLLANDSDPDGGAVSLIAVSGLYPSSFVSGFDAGLPAGAAIFGTASAEPAGGVNGSGHIRLTAGAINQSGSLVLDDLTPRRRVSAFAASFKLRIAEGSAEPADGFSFNFGPDLTIGTSGSAENGVGNGLSFCVDNYRFLPFPSGGNANTSGLKLRYGGADIAGVRTPTWDRDAFVPVSVTVDAQGNVNVWVDGTNVFGNVVVPWVPRTGRFGFYARTGGQFQSHAIDDLNINTVLTVETAREASFGGSLFGNAYVDNGYLHLNDAANSVAGSFILTDLTPGEAATSFTASFKLRIGNGSAEPADGFSFNFANDLPIGATTPAAAENGGGTGFSFCVDNYRFAPYPAGGTAATSGMKIRYGNVDIAGVQIPTWNNAAFIPVSITVASDGALTVLVDGTNVFGAITLPWTPTVGRFGLYGRTGGQNETHWVDDLAINVTTAGSPGSFSANFNSGGFGTVVLNGGVVTYSPPGGACGTDTYYYLASDGQAGGISIGTVNVDLTVANPQPPVITACASPRIVEAVENCQAALPDLTASVNVSDCASFVVLQSPAPGTLAGLGPVTVTLTVSNTYGLTATCQTTVTVQDTTLPNIVSCAPAALLPVDASCAALLPDLIAQLVVTDACIVAVAQSPVAGTVLPLGITTVTLTATDISGNATNCTTTVTVVDTTAPAITCPANITASCSGTNGATANFTVTATDNCDAAPVITCAPASGSVFPEGVTTVTCSATDVAGNTSTCSFTVTVNDPVAPVLTIARSGADALISWPQSCTQWVLEETAALGPAAAWTPVTAPVQTVGASYQVTVPAATDNKFYRLKRQP